MVAEKQKKFRLLTCSLTVMEDSGNVEGSVAADLLLFVLEVDRDFVGGSAADAEWFVRLVTFGIEVAFLLKFCSEQSRLDAWMSRSWSFVSRLDACP
jgi:hypothetical protein